jgi:hypothetical protein
MAAAEAGEVRGQGPAKFTMTEPLPEYAHIPEVRLLLLLCIQLFALMTTHIWPAHPVVAIAVARALQSLLFDGWRSKVPS